MAERTRRRNGGRQRLTAEQRRQFAKERQALVGKLITQEGFQGALVIEHVRGSQYVLRMPDGTEVFASHKKQKGQANGALTQAGWRLWEDRR
tara:strand:+ start:817 stop:1092 length:276 start_codon:yes stop_codon:yes gene_type:complete